MDPSALVITVVALGVLAWLGFLFASSVRRGAGDEVPPNLRPYLTDADLETRRLDRTLATALALSTFLAISLPLYYLGEARRHAAAGETFAAEAVDRGRFIYDVEFRCVDCHGPAGVGGVATYIEERSGITTSWLAPSLNDIFYRHDEDEVRFWVVWGRANTPMPPWGLEGGGPMNEQQVEEVMAYLRSIQFPQDEVVAQVDQRVEAERRRLAGADQVLQEAIAGQQERIAQIEAAPDRLGPAQDLLARLQEAIERGLREEPDTDGDGLSDASEAEIAEITAQGAELLQEPELAIVLDPNDPASTTDAQDRPVPDVQAALGARSELQSRVNSLQATVDSLDTLLERALEGLRFLERQLEVRPFEFDFQGLAAQHFGGDVGRAERAALLFNAYCARCHTSGYSAGIAFTQQAGSGALGPALWQGRSGVQFPDRQEHVDFIIQGSEQGMGYGVNGIGRGWMPGFGPKLPLEDIELIVDFERGL